MKQIIFCQLIALVVVFVAGCNDQGQTGASENSDTSHHVTNESKDLSSFDASRSVTSISPDLYKELADTLNIRMLEGTYKPRDSSIMHAHPDFALYVLEGSTVELTQEDGSKQNVEFKKDMAVILPAATHSAKNIGNSILRLIVVEVNRPVK